MKWQVNIQKSKLFLFLGILLFTLSHCGGSEGDGDLFDTLGALCELSDDCEYERRRREISDYDDGPYDGCCDNEIEDVIAEFGYPDAMVTCGSDDYHRITYYYWDYYNDVKGHRYFSEIAEVKFWYRHDGDPATYNDLTPYVVLVVNIEGGDYDGGKLILAQWNTWSQGYNYDWTLLQNDEWHYIIYDTDGKYVGHWGMSTPSFTLAEIQEMYEGIIDGVAVAIGVADGSETARVLVGELTIETPETD